MEIIHKPMLDKERLQQVAQFLNEHKNYNEYNWRTLINKLQEEIQIEYARLSDRSKNPYLNNLIQTKEKQVEDYLRASKTKSRKYLRHSSIISARM